MHCHHYQQSTCRACTLIEQNYQEQLSAKAKALEQSLHHEVLEVFPSSPEHFRDKVKLQVDRDHQGQLVFGFQDPKSYRVPTDLLDCPIHNPDLAPLLLETKELVESAKLDIYCPHQRTGELKGVIAFSSPTTKAQSLRLVLRSKEGLDRIRKQQSHFFPKLECLNVNIQPIPHALLEGEEEITLRQEALLHRFNDVSLYLSPQGFVQTNTRVAEALYQTARSWIQDLSIQNILDLYCGHGVFSFHQHGLALNLIGIEINPHAIALAKKTHAEFYPNESMTFVAEDATHKKISADLVLVNPPRAGLRSLADQLREKVPPYILYSSCHVGSLTQDLEKLTSLYTIERVALFDMFPHTPHFESLVLLKRA